MEVRQWSIPSTPQSRFARQLPLRRGSLREQGCACGADPTSSLPFPARAGKATTRGRVGAREEGLRTTTASTLQSPAADSSPYEGELKGSNGAPCGAIKSAAKPQTFLGGGIRTPLSLATLDSSPQRGEPFSSADGTGGILLRLTPLIPPHPCPSPPGRGRRPRGEGGVRTKGLRTPTPSTLQSPAGDSSPYEGELKGSKVAPCGAD